MQKAFRLSRFGRAAQTKAPKRSVRIRPSDGAGLRRISDEPLFTKLVKSGQNFFCPGRWSAGQFFKREFRYRNVFLKQACDFFLFRR